MSKGKFILIGIFLGLIGVYSCNTKEKHESQMLVKLDRLVSDSVPFVPEFKIGNVSSKKYSAYGLDSIQAFEFFVQQNNEQQGISRVSILRAIKNGKPYLIFDSSVNSSLRDSQLYSLDKLGFHEIKNFNLKNGSNNYQVSCFIQPASNSELPSLIVIGSSKRNKERLFGRVLPIFRRGTLNLNDSIKYQMALFNHFDQNYTAKNSFLAVTPESNKFTTDLVKYKIGDTLYLDKQVLLFENVSVSGDSIFFEHLQSLDKNFGIEPGDYAFKLRFTDIVGRGVFIKAIHDT